MHAALILNTSIGTNETIQLKNHSSIPGNRRFSLLPFSKSIAIKCIEIYFLKILPYLHLNTVNYIIFYPSCQEILEKFYKLYIYTQYIVLNLVYDTLYSMKQSEYMFEYSDLPIYYYAVIKV